MEGGRMRACMQIHNNLELRRELALSNNFLCNNNVCVDYSHSQAPQHTVQNPHVAKAGLELGSNAIACSWESIKDQDEHTIFFYHAPLPL